jgi:hypothetical protein
MEEFDFSVEEAVSSVSDTIRYTFQYREAHYTQGVWADIERLKGQGFELHKLRNAWSGEQYKGINSQWIEPDTGQRFELQFHTSSRSPRTRRTTSWSNSAHVGRARATASSADQGRW